MGKSRTKNVSFFLYLAAGVFVTLISLYGFLRLRDRPGIPRDINKQTIVQIDEFKVQNAKDFDFILSRKSIGDPAIFYLQENGKTEKRESRLVSYYSQTSFPVFYLLIGLFCLLVGFLVFLLRPEESRARIFYWAALAFSSALIISGEFYCLGKNRLSFLPGAMFNMLYPLAPAFLLHFSLTFSRFRARPAKVLIYGTAVFFGLIINMTFLYAGLAPSIETYRIQQSFYFIFRFYVVAFALLSVFRLIWSYKKTELQSVKDQIKWVFYGLFLGLGPFILLYQLPQVLGLKPLISEEWSNLFFIVIPLAFSISIVKYRLMDIDLVINRSLVYSLLTIFTVAIYLFSLEVFRGIFSRVAFLHESLFSLAAAVLAAAAFNPGRKRIQEFVDKSFFRQAYDYRKSIRGFSEKAQKMTDAGDLLNIFLAGVTEALPLEYCGGFIHSTGTEEPELGISRGEKKNLELTLPLAFSATAYKGHLELGRKKSGEKFSEGDLELLATLAGEFSLNFERIKLQEEVIYERASKEKLDELNRLKTEFVSTVSHELRTPMSSIQGLTELLQSGKIAEEKQKEKVLGTLSCESGRLSRLLHNILDFGKIEQQVKIYDFEETEIQPVIQEVLGLFECQLETEGFDLRVHLPPESVVLKVDRDSVKQTLINLLDNAIKYSTGKKEIEIALADSGEMVEIQVKDQGMGIPAEEQKKIFEGFYRVPSASRHSPKGVGLGLKIVHHIMAAHGGRVELSSEPGRGSTFKLIFKRP